MFRTLFRRLQQASPIGPPPSSAKSDATKSIIDTFSYMANVNKSQGQLFKVKAYNVAIAALRNNQSGPADKNTVSSVADVYRVLGNLNGVGTKLLAKAIEIVETGYLAEAEKMQDSPTFKAVQELTTIHGIGPKAAKKLVEEHGVKTIEDLKKGHEKGDFTLNSKQLLGLKYEADIKEKIPFDEVVLHGKVLEKAVGVVDKRRKVSSAATKLKCGLKIPKMKICICGSHRRKKSMSGDIDALLTLELPTTDTTEGTKKKNKKGPALKKPTNKKLAELESATLLENLVKELEKRNYVSETLGLGTTKFMGICKLPSTTAKKKPGNANGKEQQQEQQKGDHLYRRIDIRWVEPEAFPTAQLYFTGSKDFNTRMRSVALEKGYTLNEYGLYHLPKKDIASVTISSTNTKGESKKKGPVAKGKRVLVSTEEDVFNVLGMPYTEPEDRDV